MKDDLIVFVRIGLYMLSGRAVAGGWLPPEMVPEVVNPKTAEAAIGIIIGAGTTVWYLASKARAALLQAASDLRDNFK